MIKLKGEGQWPVSYQCEEMSSDILGTKAQRQGFVVGNVVPSGSGVLVKSRQCALLVNGSAVIDACTAAGSYTYDGSALTEPTDVYYINTGECSNNRFGANAPFYFLASDSQGELAVACSGSFNYRISDPKAFYSLYCGNGETFLRSALENTLAPEMLKALRRAMEKNLDKSGYQGLVMKMYQVSQSFSQQINSVLKADRCIEVTSLSVSSMKEAGRDPMLIQSLKQGSAAFAKTPAPAARRDFYCTYCGKKIITNGNPPKFCSNCGAPVQK